MSSSFPPSATPGALRPFDTAALPAFLEELDPADLVLEEPAGLWLPEPPTLRDVTVPHDGGRRT
jgi:hypothetical protein